MDSPSLEVMYGSVTVLELKGLVTTVIRMVVELKLEVGGLELEVTVVVDVVVAVLRRGGLVAGGNFGNVVVFRAGHPEDPVSRRTGH